MAPEDSIYISLKLKIGGAPIRGKYEILAAVALCNDQDGADSNREDLTFVAGLFGGGAETRTPDTADMSRML